ncbi:MAG: enoyl-CoA hydratase-related protein [Christensenellales bacterium]|jgi:enoyl-CoA hydratase
MYIKYEIKDHIAIIKVSREKALNALNSEVLKELSDVLDKVEANHNVYCVIVIGDGSKAFVAGADVYEMKDLDVAGGAAFGALGNRVFRKIEQLRTPVIAAVNGYALGGGFELALACDIRIAAKTAVFGFPETGLGIIPGYGGTQRLPRAIGPSAAKRLLFTAARINADEAFRLGIVDEITGADTLMEKALELANKIASQAPIAVAKLKKAVDKGFNYNMDDAIAIETRLFSECFATSDQKKAMSAFVNKQKLDQFDNQ